MLTLRAAWGLSAQQRTMITVGPVESIRAAMGGASPGDAVPIRAGEELMQV